MPGLKILFPLLPRRVRILPLISYQGRLGWQGIVPSRADKMASIAVDKGLGKLGSISDFYRELEPDRSPNISADGRAGRDPRRRRDRSWSRRIPSSGTTCRR